ncbi:MAG: T9SS type A sorting domain-containing protein [Ignavibacteria bacterium]|nr:T9SS type A sorting domain-containing protein [Ignavibacteria bacterium]
MDFNGNFKYIDLTEDVIIGSPEKLILEQNYPNPFNPVTVISFQLPSDQNVLLKIYDVNGKEVMTLINGFKEAGIHEVKFDGNNLSSGVYYYQIKSGDFKATKKMILTK